MEDSFNHSEDFSDLNSPSLVNSNSQSEDTSFEYPVKLKKLSNSNVLKAGENIGGETFYSNP